MSWREWVVVTLVGVVGLVPIGVMAEALIDGPRFECTGTTELVCKWVDD